MHVWSWLVDHAEKERLQLFFHWVSIGFHAIAYSLSFAASNYDMMPH